MTQNPRIPETPGPAKPLVGESSTLLGVVLILAGLFVYWPALHGTWLWDDTYLIVYNRDMRTLGGLERIWFGHTQTDYWPLTSTALWIELHLWTNHPFPYHVTSLALHIGSAFLLWRLFARLGLEQTWAWLGALVFVIHPLIVESVAWISELKNTLSLPLYLLAMLAWLDFDAEPRPGHYVRALAFYLLAMLAKTSGIMLPFVFLLYAWWKHNRVTLTDLKRTIPFLAVAIVLGLLTKATQSDLKAADGVILHLTPLTHLACAGTATFFYLAQFLFPLRMLPIYPRWSLEPPSALELATLPLLALILAGLWTQRRGWGRTALLGLGFFLLNLAPVSGLVTMSYMNFSWTADHLAYLPAIGLIGLVAAALQAASAAMPASSRAAVWVGVFALCLLLAWRSHQYAGVFKDEVTLWKYAAAYTPDSWPVQDALAGSLIHAGGYDEALQHAEIAVQLRPDFAKSYADLGSALALVPDRLPEALAAYEKSLALEPDNALTRLSYGSALEKADRTAEAITQYRAAIDESPTDAHAHIDLADALAKDPAQRPEAVEQYRAALQILPDDAATHMDLGSVLASLPGRTAEAAAEFQQAAQLQPAFAAAHYNLGIALEQMGRAPDAVTEFETTLLLQPDHIGARYYLAVALVQIPGRAKEAIPLLNSVLQAKPDFAPAQQLLAKLRGGS